MIAEPRVTVQEPVQGGRLVIHYAMTSRELAGGPRRDDPQPGPGHSTPRRPSAILKLNGGGKRSGQLWEAGVPELRLLAAAIADALADRPFDGPTWQSVLLRVQAEAEGRVGLNGRDLPAWCDPDVRRALVGPSPLDELLGWTDDDLVFRSGLAELTPQERDAVWYWLTPAEDGELRDAVEIRDCMAARRRRYGLPLAIESVERYLRAARAKLARLGEA